MNTYYTIYKITNQIDGKIYIGSHKTKNLNDNYMGSGKYLLHAQNKYGIENFTKEILFVFETPEEMYSKEAEIVNEDFLATENIYNLKIGGLGGWDYIHENGLTNKNKTSENFYNDFSKKGNQKHLNMLQTDETYRNNWLEKILHNQSIETRNKISKSLTGKKRNKMWITDGANNAFVDIGPDIPLGFRKGRVPKK